MPGYLVANITITDPARFAEYGAQAPAVVALYGGRYLVRGGAITAVEGELGLDRFVVLEFESMAAVRRFYDSAEYAPLLKLRTESTVSRVAFAEGFGL